MPETDDLTFERSGTPTIMDGRVVRWTGRVPWGNRPDISASRNGVLIGGGWPVMGPNAVEQVIAQLREAVAEAKRLEAADARR